MISDVDLAISLLKKAKSELEKTVARGDGEIFGSPNGEWSLSKIKRNCTVVRELVLDVRKGCEDKW